MLVSVFELRFVGDVIEVSEMRVHYLHQDHRVQGDIDPEGLGVLVAELDKAVKS